MVKCLEPELTEDDMLNPHI